MNRRPTARATSRVTLSQNTLGVVGVGVQSFLAGTSWEVEAGEGRGWALFHDDRYD